MTPATRTRLRSATAVAVALISIAATFPAFAGAVTKQHYQRRVEISCAGALCSADLPKLGANQALDIDHVVCSINTTGDVFFVALNLLPASLDFSMPLSLVWKVSAFNQISFTVGGEVNVRVPVGGQAQVGIVVSGAPNGSCSFTGTLLITS
jgi:hypothetical protein